MLVDYKSLEELNSAIANEEVLIVDFWADWCGPCKAIAPFLEALSVKYEGALKVAKVNITENMTAAQAYNITSIPSLIVFRCGSEAERVIGFKGQESLEELFSNYSGS